MGASYAWAGAKCGAGNLQIIESTPGQRVVLALQFLGPFAAQAPATFALTPRGDATEASWPMECSRPLLGRVMSLFLHLDRLIGRDFERGLARLRDLGEGPPPAVAAQAGAAPAGATPSIAQPATR